MSTECNGRIPSKSHVSKKKVEFGQWSMCKIDEHTQASSLAHPAIDPYVLDSALQDPECSAVSSVLVLYTGGTIGMRLINGVYQPVPNFLIRSLFKMPTFNDPSFKRSKHAATAFRQQKSTSLSRTDSDTSVPDMDRLDAFTQSAQNLLTLPLTKDRRRIFYSIAEYSTLLDSSDMTMDDWVRIARDIYAYYNYFDGFIVLHGTDTLAYTASALSFMLENLDKPVVLTGSQLPLFEFRSDGWNNFLGALYCAGGGFHIPEVTVFFHDTLFRGSRVVKRSSCDFHAFASPNYPALAKFGTEMTFSPNLIFHPVGVPKPFTIHTDLCRDVSVLYIFPSISAEHVATFLAPPTKGVAIRSYGAGNIPSSRKDLLEVFKSASERGVLMINVTQCYGGGVKAIYSTGVILNKYGVIPGYDITTEAALTKLAYVLGKKDVTSPEAQREMLLRSLRGETTVHPEDAQKAHLLKPICEKIGMEKNLMSYFAKLFSEAVTDESDSRGLLWARLMAPAIAGSAAACNNVTELKELFRVVGHLQLANAEGFTTLHVAVWHGHLAATRFLLEHSVSVHAKDIWGLSPLEYAIKSPHSTPELIKMLLDAGARLSMSDLQHQRAINLAVAAGDVKRLRLYRLAGCSLQDLDAEGRSPLHVAVANRKLEVVQYLIAPDSFAMATDSTNSNDQEFQQDNIYNSFRSGAGIDPSILTSWGTTALDEAKLRHFDEIVNALENLSV